MGTLDCIFHKDIKIIYALNDTGKSDTYRNFMQTFYIHGNIKYFCIIGKIRKYNATCSLYLYLGS